MAFLRLCRDRLGRSADERTFRIQYTALEVSDSREECIQMTIQSILGDVKGSMATAAPPPSTVSDKARVLRGVKHGSLSLPKSEDHAVFHSQRDSCAGATTK